MCIHRNTCMNLNSPSVEKPKKKSLKIYINYSDILKYKQCILIVFFHKYALKFSVVVTLVGITT